MLDWRNSTEMSGTDSLDSSTKDVGRMKREDSAMRN